MATATVDLHLDLGEHSGTVAILASRVRWEERMILEAFERRGIAHELIVTCFAAPSERLGLDFPGLHPV